MRVPVLRCDNGPCPYLDDRNWQVEFFSVSAMAGGYYERLLAEGWRRSGSVFYQNHCPGCSLCYPIRLDTLAFRPSKSQRRVKRRNSDLTVEFYPAQYNAACFNLYTRYVAARHPDPDSDSSGSVDMNDGTMADPNSSREAYRKFLIESPVETLMSCYYLGSGPNRKLIATGYLDILEEGLSSVYFAFDPDEGARSLGTYSVMMEAELCVRLGFRWYYLGFYVPGSRKMSYKRNFRPYQIAIDGEWQDIEM
jgi:arginyl-tRNA--protein-N-Asp/Glu arginylyltransferase